MSGVQQAVFQNQRSFVVNPESWPGNIGIAYGGGYFAGQINDGGTVYNLVVAPNASGSASGKSYKTTIGTIAGTTSDIDGYSNTSNLTGASTPAGEFCWALTIGGHSDWYLPATNEQEVVYYYLKPTTDSNSTSYGSNPNAVAPEPVSTNYTSSEPPQTSASVFMTGNSEAFTASGSASYYWASTQMSGAAPYPAYRADAQYFLNGTQGDGYKPNTAYTTRAIRKVAV